MKLLAHVHVAGWRGCHWIEDKEGTKLTTHVEHAAVFDRAEFIAAAISLATTSMRPVEIIAVPYEAQLPSSIRELIRLD